MSLRIVRFGIVGIANTAVGLAVLYGALFAGLGDFASNALGYGCGLVMSFFLHRGWTFAGRSKSFSRDAGGFVLAWAAAYVANLAVVATGRSLGFKDNPLVQLCAIVVFSACFYLLTSRIVFTAGKRNSQGSNTVG